MEVIITFSFLDCDMRFSQ